ncbi:MAG TPA: Na+ dependent nucleoside transporter N-terminal domain-containing protein, partial [Thermoanaerobaculia bacterium]|nr:Na+ dependent nucleoside transporter N-terminal domain-containing protein [Thermoanaerobaculia bacterium]
MERFTGVIGFVAILAIAWLISTNRKAIKWRPVVWGLVLQIVVAILVLKGQLIAASLAAITLPLEKWGAALLFIGIAVVVTQVAKRMPPGGARRGLWIAFGVVSVYLFLTFNLLAYLFETMKHVVNNLIGYTQEGSKFVFGSLGAS